VAAARRRHDSIRARRNSDAGGRQRANVDDIAAGRSGCDEVFAARHRVGAGSCEPAHLAGKRGGGAQRDVVGVVGHRRALTGVGRVA
jgi:hypothetical protein